MQQFLQPGGILGPQWRRRRHTAVVEAQVVARPVIDAGQEWPEGQQGLRLTETETRVATLAAQGASNKQIASALFMGVSTVESHLSHVYRKLGIRSRAGLGARLATPADGATTGRRAPARVRT